MNFCTALWNGKDPIIKERLFGLTGPEGNHAEDVKELYYYLDSTPTHSYMKHLYKYPQSEFPYDDQKKKNLGIIAEDISRNLIRIFKKNENGKRPVNARRDIFTWHE